MFTYMDCIVQYVRGQKAPAHPFLSDSIPGGFGIPGNLHENRTAYDADGVGGTWKEKPKRASASANTVMLPHGMNQYMPLRA